MEFIHPSYRDGFNKHRRDQTRSIRFKKAANDLKQTVVEVYDTKLSQLIKRLQWCAFQSSLSSDHESAARRYIHSAVRFMSRLSWLAGDSEDGGDLAQINVVIFTNDIQRWVVLPATPKTKLLLLSRHTHTHTIRLLYSWASQGHFTVITSKTMKWIDRGNGLVHSDSVSAGVCTLHRFQLETVVHYSDSDIRLRCSRATGVNWNTL